MSYVGLSNKPFFLSQFLLRRTKLDRLQRLASSDLAYTLQERLTLRVIFPESLTNIGPGRKSLALMNTLAYYVTVKITTVKSLMVLYP